MGGLESGNRKTPNLLIDTNYTFPHVENDEEALPAKCIHKQRVYNPTRCKEHFTLGKCPVYKLGKAHEIPDKHLIWREIGFAIFVGGKAIFYGRGQTLPEGLSKAQTRFPAPRQEDALDHDPRRHCYDVVKSQVTEKVKSIQFLNVTFDESTNINERLLNMSISTPEASDYYESEVMGDLRLSAEQISEIVVEKLTRFLGSSPDWSRINSMTTDTCSTMKAVWKILEEKPMFQHTFFIPCDSHGLQVVVRDLIFLPTIKPVFDPPRPSSTIFDLPPCKLLFSEQ